MSDVELKPLYWTPEPGIGYDVTRRSDGGMQITFSDVSRETIRHWREFALEHLYDSDRLTRNLYDLRKISEIPEDAIHFAMEANSDPSARNIRLAVVVASAEVRNAILEIAASTPAPGGGAEIRLFTDIGRAEEWLARPLNSMV